MTVTPQLSNGIDRQVWVNWTFTGTSPVIPSFFWNLSGGNDLADPEISSTTGSASVNLNNVVAGSTYEYKVAVSNCYGPALKAGSFNTVNAPTNGFEGWIYSTATNPYELNQIGAPISGATINSIWASCVNPNGAPVRIGFPAKVTNQITNLPAATTDSNGYFSFTFPLTWTEEPNGYVLYTLSNSGTCDDKSFPGSIGDVSNSMVTLNASANGYWNASQFLSSTTSATNDYRSFGLPPNGQGVAAQGVAFVHTADVECGITIENGFTQVINSYTGANGFSDTQSYGQVLIANPVSNGDATITFDYHNTGLVNETGAPVVMNTYAFGAPFNPGTNAIYYNDPDSSPPSGSTLWTYGGTGGSDGWYNGGSYTSTSGLDMTISLSAGWAGASFGPSIELKYTTTTGTSSSHEILCSSMVNPPSGYDYQFYIYLDGSGASNSQAVNVHVWYDDECTQGTLGCP